MKKGIKRILAFVLVLVIFVNMSDVVFAMSGSERNASTCYDSVLNLIKKQSHSKSNSEIEKYYKHFMQKSNYKPGKKFPYPRDGGWAGTISDGTYSYYVGDCNSCYAYSKFISGVVYGKNGSATSPATRNSSGMNTESGIRELLVKNAQFGEHIRIDNTHSITFLGGDDTGFYGLEYLTSKIAFVYYSYSSLANKAGSSKVWIYNADPSINDYEEPEPQEVTIVVPPIPSPTVGAIGITYSGLNPYYSASVGVGSGAQNAYLRVDSNNGEWYSQMVPISDGQVNGPILLNNFSNPLNGSYTVTITVTDPRGKEASNSVQFGYSHEVILGDKVVNLHAGESYRLYAAIDNNAQIISNICSGGTITIDGEEKEAIHVNPDGWIQAIIPGTYELTQAITYTLNNQYTTASRKIIVNVGLDKPEITDFKYYIKNGIVLLNVDKMIGADGLRIVHSYGEDRKVLTNDGLSVGNAFMEGTIGYQGYTYVGQRRCFARVPYIRFNDLNHYRVYSYKNIGGHEYVSELSDEISFEVGDIPYLSGMSAKIYKDKYELSWDKIDYADYYLIDGIKHDEISDSGYKIVSDEEQVKTDSISYTKNGKYVNLEAIVIPWRDTWSSEYVIKNSKTGKYKLDCESLFANHGCCGEYSEDKVPVYYRLADNKKSNEYLDRYGNKFAVKYYNKGSEIGKYIPDGLSEGDEFCGWFDDNIDFVSLSNNYLNEDDTVIAYQPLFFIANLSAKHDNNTSNGKNNETDQNNQQNTSEPSQQQPDSENSQVVKEQQKQQVTNFVSRMYTVALGREAEEGGLNDWSGQLINRKSDGATLARGFITGNEFKNKNLSNEQYVDTLYHTFFNRDADTDGRNGWLNMLAGGATREEVLAGFVNSQEFANLCDEYGIARGTMETDGSSIYNAGVRDFVLRNYTETLGRKGETTGVEYWSYRINKRELTPRDVAVSFLNSEEFLNKNLNNEEYVKVLYRTFMGREYDNSGLAYWKGKLDGGEMSRDEVVNGFADSQEFHNIMAQYGL